jgi:hypothetical protein
MADLVEIDLECVRFEIYPAALLQTNGVSVDAFR